MAPQDHRMLRITLENTVPTLHHDLSWKRAIVEHIRGEYTGWTNTQVWQASRILHHIKRLAAQAHEEHRDYDYPAADKVTKDMDMPPLDPSMVNAQSIISRFSGGQEDWAGPIRAWISDHWDSRTQFGKGALVEALHEVEKTMGGRWNTPRDVSNQKIIKTLDDKLESIRKDEKALSEPELPDLMAHPAGYNTFHEGHTGRPASNPANLAHERDNQTWFHSLGTGPQIGRRAAAHYRTTQARWQAGQGW